MYYQKEIDVLDHYDVVVAGGGPAGICAAAAAARQGKKTALIERYGVLGGNLTVGCVGPILGNVAKGTMYDELRDLLLAEKEPGSADKAQDMERTKGILLDFVVKEGVFVYLQTPIVDVVCEDEKLTGVITAWKNGMAMISGEQFVDATGDGDVACFAGVPFEMGRREDGELQPVSLMYIVENVDESKAIIFFPRTDDGF